MVCQFGERASTRATAASRSKRTVSGKVEEPAGRECTSGRSETSRTLLKPMPLCPMPSPGGFVDSPVLQSE